MAKPTPHATRLTMSPMQERPAQKGGDPHTAFPEAKFAATQSPIPADYATIVRVEDDESSRAKVRISRRADNLTDGCVQKSSPTLSPGAGPGLAANGKVDGPTEGLTPSSAISADARRKSGEPGRDARRESGEPGQSWSP